MNTKDYLGDGVYAEFDGYQIRLSAEDGVRTTAVIFLEPKVLQSLVYYAGKMGIELRQT